METLKLQKTSQRQLNCFIVHMRLYIEKSVIETLTTFTFMKCKVRLQDLRRITAFSSHLLTPANCSRTLSTFKKHCVYFVKNWNAHEAYVNFIEEYHTHKLQYSSDYNYYFYHDYYYYYCQVSPATQISTSKENKLYLCIFHMLMKHNKINTPTVFPDAQANTNISKSYESAQRKKCQHALKLLSWALH